MQVGHHNSVAEMSAHTHVSFHGVAIADPSIVSQCDTSDISARCEIYVMNYACRAGRTWRVTLNYPSYINQTGTGKSANYRTYLKDCRKDEVIRYILLNP